ncbi:LacI family transcriptional regulator [Actinoalloteichus hoggarensis]|uniref:Ribose operon repressor n=1 Tax=Actinoalloteichus hoggarensis TaxID=1470176 RepID=A0A221W562_9PSEU|nr:LacI family DNA-binding transcriptional regulator [Actinoalloteichus hoggarensis]ASO20796.1 Ribose operon repressor [Actinoalloteichus hoggarensis]MBB5920726.1 LacI family transcriptional regulator [Actinoalloteichus hoggarensis]
MNRGTRGEQKRSITLTDVARLAGVSVATASKALNGRRQVRAETRERVLAAAESLSFTPNPFAQALNMPKSGTVGMLTSDLDGRFALPILMGAEDAFGSGATSVLLCDARGDAERERRHVATLLARRVDGLIVVGSRTDPRPSLGQQLPVPVVYAYAPSEDDADVSFVPDNVRGGALAVEHLVAGGRRRIALLAGDADYAAARDRVAGVRAALHDAGLDLVGGAETYGEWSEAWGRQAADALLTENPDVDAVLCGNDQVARGALETLRERGRRVPEDVWVAGFDNWEVLTASSRPPLTSVDMNLEELGRTAARHLFHAIDGERHGGIVTLPVRLVIRETTGDVRV